MCENEVIITHAEYWFYIFYVEHFFFVTFFFIKQSILASIDNLFNCFNGLCVITPKFAFLEIDLFQITLAMTYKYIKYRIYVYLFL